MAYTWDATLGRSIDAGDPRRGTFSTGNSTARQTSPVVWPTNAPVPTFGGNIGSINTTTARPIAGLGFDLGQIVGSMTGGGNGGANSPQSNGVNTAQIDGNSGFVSALGGLGRALLSGIGVSDGDQPQQQAQPVSYTQGGGAFDLQTLAIYGGIAAAIYYVATR